MQRPLASRHTTSSSCAPRSEIRNSWRFLIRRYFRIAPAYYLSLILAAAFSSAFLGGYGVLYDMSTIGLSQVYNPERIVFTPDLDVCDVMMPGMNGYEVVAALRADPNTADMPVMLLTSLAAMTSAGTCGPGAVLFQSSVLR